MPVPGLAIFGPLFHMTIRRNLARYCALGATRIFDRPLIILFHIRSLDWIWDTKLSRATRYPANFISKRTFVLVQTNILTTFLRTELIQQDPIRTHRTGEPPHRPATCETFGILYWGRGGERGEE